MNVSMLLYVVGNALPPAKSSLPEAYTSYNVMSDRQLVETFSFMKAQYAALTTQSRVQKG